MESFLPDSENSEMDTQMSVIGNSQYLHMKLMETESDGQTKVSSPILIVMRKWKVICHN